MWNLLTCNPSYEEFLRKKESRRLKESLNQIVPNGGNESIKLIKLSKMGTKKLRLREDNLRKIEENNHLLLKKMLVINNTPSSLNMNSRIYSHNKIAIENRKLLERLQGTHSVYSTEKWENSFKHHEWVKFTHTKSYSRIDRKLSEDKSKSNFSICNPGVFENLKSKFYKNYD